MDLNSLWNLGHYFKLSLELIDVIISFNIELTQTHLQSESSFRLEVMCCYWCPVHYCIQTRLVL